MRIRLLGTGTPTPSLRRMSSGYLIEIADHKILFDHGFGAYHRLLEAGVSPTAITHLFFSHLHYDHCGDYARLVLTRWDQGAGRIPELKVFGPPPLAKMTRQLFDADGVFGPDIVARTDNATSQVIYEARDGKLPRKPPRPAVTEISPGDTLTDGDDWSVRVAAVAHVQPQLTCYGFRLESKEGSIVYSGDSGPCASMERLADRCDVLVHMCHYLSGTQLGKEFARACMGHMELAELAAKAEVKNLVLSHMTEQIDKPGVRERMVIEIASVYKGNIFLGEDLMEIPVGNPKAAKLL